MNQQLTTSYLIPEFQVFDRTSGTLGQGFKLSAEDLDIPWKI